MIEGFIEGTRRKSARVFSSLVAPRSKDINTKRQEFILNILLINCIFVSAFATCIAVYNMFRAFNPYIISSITIVVTILIFFFVLYIVSRLGYPKIASFFFIGVLILPTIYTLITWGMYLPVPLLVYALIIIMSSILLGTRVAFAVTTLISAILIFVTYLQIKTILPVDLSWIHGLDAKVEDAVMFSAGLLAITTVSWLSNREIESSLRRAIESEKALQKERDQLELKVEERTRELKQAQLEKMFHMYRFVEFGRMASGFFHDLSHPLTTLSLNVETLRDKFPSEEVERAHLGTMKMVEYIHAMRKQLQKHDIKALFYLDEEITDVLYVVTSKARECHVELVCNTEHIRIFGNSLRFNQLVTNILTNAVDAYESVSRKQHRQVTITLKKKNSHAILTVQDFGCGIPPENLKRIFDPFFTTKTVNAGTGLGLPICKTIVNEEFHGTITVESTVGKGSTFIVTIPIKKK